MNSRSGGSRLRASDLGYIGVAGIRAKPGRAVLSALGIAIGVAAMISVIGISASSQAVVNARLDALGTNLLKATALQPSVGEALPLPEDASARVARIPGVLSTSSVANLSDVHIYRSSHSDPDRTGGMIVSVAELDLPEVVGASVRTGSWLNAATAAFPTTVLGSTAAERLAVTEPGAQVWLGGFNATVVGILDPVPLASELNVSAFVGGQFASQEWGFTGNPTELYQRTEERSVVATQKLIAPAVQPERPAAVAVSRPSDALVAVDAVDDAFTGLLVGLGSIALLVGAIGVANTMVISVIERRREIGLRRALGATRGHIRLQFLTEATILSLLGGLGGAVLGSLVTFTVALLNGWIPVVPVEVLGAGVAATMVVGALAGLYPAMRASRTPPTEALSA